MRIGTYQIAPKLEIRAAGAYVIAPPSVHPSGHIYQWAPERGDWDALPKLPAEWVALQPPLEATPNDITYLPITGNTVALKRLDGLARHLAATPKGGRHQALYSIARTLGQLVAPSHLTHYEIHNTLFDAAAANGILAEDGDRNVTQTITDGINKGIADGPDPGHHETGNVPNLGHHETFAGPNLGHHETGEHNPYTLTLPSEDDDDVPEINWPKFKFEDFDDTRWLIEPIIPAGSSVALYATSKTGKSLFAFDLVAAAASGRPILGGPPLEAPIHILYVDQENTRREAWDRAYSLGYFGPDHEGSLATLGQHMHYANMYPWPPLDTEAGGKKLLEKAHKVKAKLVVIDTLIRTVSGEENSADTIKNFYRYTGMALKEAGIALLRIDHAGKDLTRGQRGTSAKRDDVEVVWLLKPTAGSLPGKTMLTLKREAARVDWIQEDIHITRNEGPPLTHTIPDSLALTSEDITIVRYLQDVAGLWRHNVTVKGARQALNDSTHTAKQVRLAHVVKWMKRYGDTSEKEGNAEGNAKKTAEGNAEGNARQERVTPRSEGGNARVTPLKSINRGEGNKAPPIGGAWYPLKIPKRKTSSQSHGKNTRTS